MASSRPWAPEPSKAISAEALLRSQWLQSVRARCFDLELSERLTVLGCQALCRLEVLPFVVILFFAVFSNMTEFA
jgi:hypothetical protein